MTSALHYTNDAAHYLAFYCPGGHRGPNPREPRSAEINFHGGVPCTLQCEPVEEKMSTFRLHPGHERWFTEVCSKVCMTVITVCQLEVRCAKKFYGTVPNLLYKITLKELELLIGFTSFL